MFAVAVYDFDQRVLSFSKKSKLHTELVFHTPAQDCPTELSAMIAVLFNTVATNHR